MIQEPPASQEAHAELLARFLDYFRDRALEKLRGLDDHDRRAAAVPSGWAPVELVWHLASMERRWIVWGFLGEEVPDPWRDGEGDRWVVPEEVSVDDVAAELSAVGRRTSQLLAGTPLDAVAPPGPRFTGELPTLGWIVLHVLHEHARHLGHLDVAVELLDGPLGE